MNHLREHSNKSTRESDTAKHATSVEDRSSSLPSPVAGAEKIPGNVREAIELFMKFGNETIGITHNGYYSEGGWPHNTLKEFLSTR